MDNPSTPSRGPWHPPTLPIKKKRKVPLWSVVPGVTNILRPWQPSIVRVGTHWIEEIRRTVLCAGPESGCSICQDKPKWRWTGYLLCRLERIRWWEDRRECNASGAVILHITEHAIESCPQLADETLDLTRVDIEANRAGKSKRSPVIMRTRAAITPPIEPASFALLSYLLDMYAAPNNPQKRSAKGGN